MIEIKDLVKVYGTKKAVNGISFTVEDGEVLGFLGPNGAGKSTTMNIITGYLSSTSGSVKVNGYDILEKPEEAKKFYEATGVDALAVAIGSAHGVYKTKPNLNIERLKEIRKEIGVPLVLHGGSGLSDEDFRNTIREGIAKVNIFTDLCLAGDAAIKECCEKGLGYLETRNIKVNAIKEAVKKKIKLFGSENKA